MPHAETDAAPVVTGPGIVDNDQFQVFVVTSHPFGADEVCYFLGHEDRDGIVGTERGEFLQHMIQIGSDIGQLDFSVDIDLRGQHFIVDRFPDNTFEFLFERFYIFDFQGQSGSIFMPAIILQKFTALRDSVIQIETFDRPG